MSSNSSASPATTTSSSSSPSHATRRLSTQSTHGSSHKSPPPPSQNGSSSSEGDTQTTEVVAAAVVAGLLLVVLVAACACGGKSKKRRAGAAHQPPGGLMFYADSSGFKGNSSSDYYYTTGARPPQWQQNQAAAHSPSINKKAAAAQNTPLATSSDEGGGHPPPVPPPPLPMPAGLDTTPFSYEELESATGGFSAANLLGQGGFGYVYKGVLLLGGGGGGGKKEKEVAVKQLKAGSGQGEREFQAEVDTISRVQHRHLVSLVGYCIAGTQRLLVYEFVPNQTLEHHLHGKGVPVMEWTMRLRIALGAAKGLAYLHEECDPRIIHRDIKSANILLDNDFEAMVADFGLAKLTNVNNTHVSTRVMGTFGYVYTRYLAPEYASSGKLTEKSDVFSYGVMLLELLTGRRPGDRSSYGHDGLVDWARVALSRALADGNYDPLIDPRLDGDYDQTEAARVVACAAASIRHAGRQRPKMSQIVKALQGGMPLEELNNSGGVRQHNANKLSSGSSEYGSGSYTAQMERIRRAALPSPEYSAEYPGSVPEFGHPSPGSSVDSRDRDDRRRGARR
ncbi:hypothetical protein PR202_gb12210 [Eleusine coracana subsp. coracana]|uniref:non-specific serine/threonine protein kinase n=1 Tax=Eleusine coracana subsp. coracana TaxID=191504 RepID=A0AAV5EP96_ELECO|nr:hypothetical protein PR202_gb12210 [Eleusine coracana subsp. coracana]